MGTLAAAAAVVAAAQAQAQTTAQPAVTPSDTFDVNEYIVRGNSVLQPIDIEKAVYPYAGPGRSLHDVEAARDALQKTYQDKGYQSVVVELPSQRVTNGVIYLQVVETKVGRVRIEGATYASPQLIRDAVPALTEGTVPDFTRAQAQLADLNKTADRQVVPLLRPGVMPQTVDVDLKVDDHRPLHGSLELNNDRSPDTAPLRTVASLSYSNVWQLGHVLSGSFLIAPQRPRDAQVYSLSYLAPLERSHWSLLATAFHSNSNVASLGGTNVLGKGTAFGLSAVYALPSSDTYSQSASVGVDYRHFDERDTFAGFTTTAPLTYAPLTLSYNGQLNRRTSVTTIGASLVTNLRGIGSNANEFDNKRYNATSDFLYGKLDFTHLQTLAHDMQVNARVDAQFANSPLVSSEQFAAGGMNTVRGYLQAEETGDNGVIASLEWRSPSIARYLGSGVNEWRFHAFVDAAHLWLLSPLPEQTASFNLLSVGIGSRIKLLRYAAADVEMAFPLKAGVNTRAYNPRFDFYLRASF
ncbi:hypothetical protein Busp01_54240 [Trinickia caryophylli]|nr:ShlB/FhaC/HecB family hemolysin secretion/activation protein [Trinickia caryophylli]TRX20168.1 ShlB/FhaC/HecB family hemolysin secretion/activation protein [Trinickia caryophylli]GLU35582.1 hypothetical protein Busp01_54240 [Trinickia caryophylli]